MASKNEQYNARVVLAENVKRLMREHVELTSPAKLSRRCFWPSGKKAGKRVSERRIRYLLDPRTDDNFSPTLDLIIAVAASFNVPAWQLLVDDRQTREWVVDRIFAGPTAPGTGDGKRSPTLHEATTPPTPAPPRSTGAGRRKGVRDRR